jgi:hypothetical protein
MSSLFKTSILGPGLAYFKQVLTKTYKGFFYLGSTLWILLFLGGVISKSSLATNNVTSQTWSCPVYGLDFYGNDLEKVMYVSSWEDCGYMCHLDPNCLFWTWDTDRHEVKRSPNEKHSGK